MRKISAQIIVLKDLDKILKFDFNIFFYETMYMYCALETIYSVPGVKGHDSIIKKKTIYQYKYTYYYT